MSDEECPLMESIKAGATIQHVQDVRAEKYGLVQAWSMGVGIPLILLVVTMTGAALIDGQEEMNAKLAEFNTSIQLQGQRMDFVSDKIEDLEKANATRMDFVSDKIEDLEKADATIIEKFNKYIAKGD